MKVSYGEGVAIHTGSESCIGARKGAGVALTGVRTGQPLSREIETPPRKGWLLRGADAGEISGWQNWKRRYRETLGGSAWAVNRRLDVSTFSAFPEVPFLSVVQHQL